MTTPRHRRPEASSSALRDSASSRGRSSAQQYSRQEITRNRIVAIVVLVVLVALVISLVSCVARTIAGPGGDQAGGNQATASSQASGAGSGESQSGQALGTVVTQVNSVVHSEGVEDPWVASGRFSTGDAELDQMIKGFCDANTNPDLSLEDNAFNAYCSAVWSEYKERENNQYPTGPTWDIEYAKQAINEGSVNCYEQVALAEYVLKYFGYTEAYAEPCLILRQSGEYGDHGLLYVTDRDGRKCLCDPAFGANGWMLDNDIYSVKLMDVGQDPSEFTIAPFEEVVPASWI